MILILNPPLREEGHEVAEGVDSMIEMQEIKREKSQVQFK